MTLVRNSERSRRLSDDERPAGGWASRNQGVCRTRTGRARHTHQRTDARCTSASGGATPSRSATATSAATRRFSSVVRTRKRSKHAKVKASPRAATGRVWPGGIGGVASASMFALTTTSPFSITINRAPAMPGSVQSTLESTRRVNQIARRRASAPRNARHSRERCTSSGVQVVMPRVSSSASTSWSRRPSLHRRVPSRSSLSCAPRS